MCPGGCGTERPASACPEPPGTQHPGTGRRPPSRRLPSFRRGRGWGHSQEDVQPPALRTDGWTWRGAARRLQRLTARPRVSVRWVHVAPLSRGTRRKDHSPEGRRCLVPPPPFRGGVPPRGLVDAAPSQRATTGLTATFSSATQSCLSHNRPQGQGLDKEQGRNLDHLPATQGSSARATPAWRRFWMPRPGGARHRTTCRWAPQPERASVERGCRTPPPSQPLGPVSLVSSAKRTSTSGPLALLPVGLSQGLRGSRPQFSHEPLGSGHCSFPPS